MSRDGTGREGVTNHLGQVFTGHENEVYEDLVCCDASVIPTALGECYAKAFSGMHVDHLTRREPLGDYLCYRREIR